MVGSESTGTKLRVLICAFACAADPSTKFFGGGDILAWNLVKRLGRVHRLRVLTAAQNCEAIEAALKKQPLPDVQFVYLDLPGWLHALMRHQVGIQLYAYLWQWKAYFVAEGFSAAFDSTFFTISHTKTTGWPASSEPCCPSPTCAAPAGVLTGFPNRSLRVFAWGVAWRSSGVHSDSGSSGMILFLY